MSVKTTTKMYVKIEGSWVDVTGDLFPSVNFNWGFSGTGVLDVVCKTGSMRFSLNNYDQKYTPNSASALSGWKSGLEVKYVYTYDGEDYVRFKGKISSIGITTGAYGEKIVEVAVVDWMDNASKYAVSGTTIQTDKTADQVINTILGSMPVQPDSTDFDTGINIFPASFDTVTTQTKAISEFAKIATSEFGNIYLKKDQVYGEKLVFENNHARPGIRKLTDIPESTSVAGILSCEDDSNLETEDSNPINLNATTSATFDETRFVNLKVVYGNELVNRVKLKVEPKSEDASAVVLFTLDHRVKIASGRTKTIRGKFTDPTSRNPVTGKNMVDPPVSGTDYTMNTLSDGTGSNITSDLTVSGTFSSEGFEYECTNNNGATGYIWVQARGNGVSSNNVVEYIAEDTVSIDGYGEQPKTVSQPYQQELEPGILEVEKVVEYKKRPRLEVEEIDFVANVSDENMMVFLNIDIGDLISVSESQSGVDGYFYIQAVNANSLGNGDDTFVTFSLKLKQQYCLDKGLSFIPLVFTEGNALAIDYGQVPYLWNVDQKSISVWANQSSRGSASNTLLAMTSGSAGWWLGVTTSGSVQFIQSASGANGTYTGGSLPLNQNTNIIVARDAFYATNSPTIYLGGTAQTVIVNNALGGTINEDGLYLTIGNYKSATSNFGGPFGGTINDARVYSGTILGATDATTIAGAGVGADQSTALDGAIQFQGPCIISQYTADYVTNGIGGEWNVLDNVYGIVGKKIGTGSSSTGGTVTYTSQPDEAGGIDNFLPSGDPTLNYGTATYLDAGNASGQTTRILLKFDLTLGTNPPPVSASVISATLTITPIADFSTNNSTLSVYRCLRDWGELTSTWNKYDASNNWSAAGANNTTYDRESASIGSVEVSASPAIGTPIDITLNAAKVQEWIGGLTPNYGMVLRTNTENSDWIAYASSSHGTVTYRPKLTVVYI